MNSISPPNTVNLQILQEINEDIQKPNLGQ